MWRGMDMQRCKVNCEKCKTGMKNHLQPTQDGVYRVITSSDRICDHLTASQHTGIIAI